MESSNLIVTENSIYYIDKNDYNAYKMNLNGEKVQKITTHSNDDFGDEICSNVNICGEHIYYVGISGIYIMDKNGENCRIIYSFSSTDSGEDIKQMIVKDDRIYFTKGIMVDPLEKMILYSIKRDGTNLKKLSDKNIIDINIQGNSIYYRGVTNEPYKVINYKTDLDGKNKEIYDDEIDLFGGIINNLDMYYTFENGWIKKAKE